MYWAIASGIEDCSVASCTAAQFQATGLDAVFAIATNGSSLFWTDSTTGNVMSCAASSGACTNPITIDALRNAPTVIAADGNNVYWAEADGVMQCPATGCGGNQPTALASGQQNANSIAVDATYVYWTTGASVVRASIGVANSATTIAQNQGGAATVGVGQQAVYWSVSGGAVMMLGK
jgi:hypothetical protein